MGNQYGEEEAVLLNSGGVRVCPPGACRCLEQRGCVGAGCSFRKKQLFVAALLHSFEREQQRQASSSPAAVVGSAGEEALRWKFSTLDSNHNQVGDRASACSRSHLSGGGVWSAGSEFEAAAPSRACVRDGASRPPSEDTAQAQLLCGELLRASTQQRTRLGHERPLLGFATRLLALWHGALAPGNFLALHSTLA